ncbi:MAG TPA: hypothetical protein VEF04_04090, partial [Blastocatellia bacterium]|nr:hypothetical protein [Blastocatellia bacterium]
LEPLQLPDSKNFGPLSIPLPVLNRFSQCESRELRDSINAAKALRTVKEIQAVQDEESRKKDGNTKIVKVAAQQRIAQGVKVMISNVAARRVLVNCSTNFQMQSGLQINFKCT